MNRIIINGVSRPLDRLPEHPGLFASLPRLRDAYSVDTSTLVESDQITAFSPRVLDQIQNGCVGHGGCTMGELAFLQAGVALPGGGLSPTFLYALINGGRDRGAIIGDLIQAWSATGNATAATYPESEYFTWTKHFEQGEKEAASWKADEMYAFETFEELAVAASRGFAIADSVMVGDTFENLDVDGVVGVDEGSGNHCVAAGSLRKFKGVVQIGHQNSWGIDWGLKGRFWTTSDHVNCQSNYSGVAIKSIVQVTPPPSPL